ncbi:MAG: Gfo/Idh/MocA family oxidoreductase [Thermoflexales bacterium]
MASRKLRVGVLGAGAWANNAHIPGWQRHPNSEVVVLCDPQKEMADALATKYSIPKVETDHRAVIERADIDVIDVVTPSAKHFELAWAALEAGKHVLVEKPVAYDFRDTLRARDLAASKGLKTKVGLTFRYAPAMQYMRDLIVQGYIGTPFIFNGFEQNSQWLDPMNPLRQIPDPYADQSQIHVSSLEGYGAPVIDIMHLCVGADLQQIVATMKNFIPERMVRQTGTVMRQNIDDGDIFMGEFTNGAIGSIQTSFVTVGNYPGIEARVWGSEGALWVRLIEEFGVCEVLRGAKPNDVEFKQLEVPQKYYPPGGSPRENWRTLFYANLISNFVEEILSDGPENQGNFTDGAWVQEVINAAEVSFRKRAWQTLPLPR